MDGVDNKETHSDDIHNMEQRKDGPMIDPALQNDELKQYDYKNLEEAANAPLSKVDDTEEELEHRASLGKRAWNFIHQHRPELNRELNQGNVTPGEKHDRHRGTVTDPDTDMRLKENKEKEEKSQEQDNSEKDKSQDHLQHADRARKDKMINQLDKLNKEVRKAASDPNKPYPVKPGMENNYVHTSVDFTPQPSKPGDNPNKPWVPKPKTDVSKVAWTATPQQSVVAPVAPNKSKPNGSSISLKPGSGPIGGELKDHSSPFVDHPNQAFADHARALGGPGIWDKAKATAVQQKMSEHPTFGPITPPAPKPTASPKLQPSKPVSMPYPVTSKVASEIVLQEKALRGNVRVGSMVSGILGDKPANTAKLMEIREKLHKAMHNEQDINARNEILAGISLTANLLLNMGFIKDVE